MKSIFNYLAIIVLLLLCKCTATRYLPKEEYFYDDTEIVVKTSENRKSQNQIKSKILEGIPLRTTQTFFGSRPEAWFYYIAGEPKENAFIRKFVKNRIGAKPVLLSDVQPQRIARLLQDKLWNEGYLTSRVTYKVEKNERKRSGKIFYNVALHRPYYVGEVRYPPKADSIYAPVFNALSQSSLLKPGQQFSLSRLQAELDRIEKGFRNSGFYFFNGSHLVFEADSTQGDHHINLLLSFNGTPPKRARQVYKLNKPVVYCDPPLPGDTSMINLDTLSSVPLDVIYIGSQRKNLVRPDFLASILNLEQDRIFSLEEHETTRNLLMNLDMFQSISINYAPTLPDSGLLNPSIVLRSQRKKTFQSDLKIISKSGGTIGPQLSFTFSNRNLMKGAERLDLSLSGAYETQLTNQSTGTLDAFELKLESSLVIKRLLWPFTPQGRPQSLPSTVFKTGVNFQNRIDYYSVAGFNVSVGYSWKYTAGPTHQFFPLDLSYIKTRNVSEEFYDVLALNPSLAVSLQDQFIFASRYTYAIDGRKAMVIQWQEDHERTRNFLIFKGTLEQAGNFLSAVMNRTREAEEEPHEILGSPYSQHIRGEANVSHYWTLNYHQNLVTNVFAAAGYAYGNMETLPYVKQFSMGGATSVRAFPARTIGPGSYNYKEDQARIEDSISFTDQLGDIALQANIEYRFDISKMFKGGVFVDAGNIWTFREDSARTGAQFKGDEFYKQLAIGAGAGLRLALGVLLLRFDVAVPLKRQDTAWLLKTMNWNDSAWRRENIVLNIAVGYPF